MPRQFYKLYDVGILQFVFTAKIMYSKLRAEYINIKSKVIYIVVINAYTICRHQKYLKKNEKSVDNSDNVVE